MNRGKVLLLGYDQIIVTPADRRECSFCLTMPQVETLLALVEFTGWQARWISDSGAAIDLDTIEAFRDDIRRRLMGCGCDDGTNPPILTRFDPTTGQIQISTDGGATWQQSSNDPQVAGIALPPAVDGTHATTKCDAAHNVVVNLQNQVVQIIADKTSTRTAEEIAAALAGAVAGIFGTLVSSAIVLLVGGVLSLFLSADVDAIEAAFTGDTWNQFLCLVYKHTEDNGTYTQDDIGDIIGNAHTVITSGYAADCLSGLVQALGVLGMNNAAASGFSSGTDCSACDAPCNYSTWGVWDGVGTLISRSATKIVVQGTAPGDGHVYANVTSGNPDTCCCSVQIVGNTAADGSGRPVIFSAIGAIHCGTAIDSGNLYFDVGSEDINSIAVKADAAFYLIITSTDPCP